MKKIPNTRHFQQLKSSPIFKFFDPLRCYVPVVVKQALQQRTLMSQRRTRTLLAKAIHVIAYAK